MSRPFCLILIALVGVLPRPAAATAPATAYDSLAAIEARVAAIAFRLTTANARWCPDRAPQLGWLLSDRRLYRGGDWPAARKAYDAADGDHVFIAAIAPGSPAARAGLAVGQPLPGIGWTSPSPSNATADTAGGNGDDGSPFGRIDQFETLVGQLPAAATILIPVGAGENRQMVPVEGCKSDFRVEARDRPTGAADGRLVLISAGLARFAKDDDELAATIAHELAHNILRHRARLDAAGVDRGLLKQVGRNARLFRQTEIEADRLSVWLLAGAGYDPAAAVRFWQRFGQREGRPLIQAGTHPRWQDRVASIEAERHAIEAARRAHHPLEPPLIAAPPPLE